MHKYINLLFLLILFVCQSTFQPAAAQEEKSLKESFGDLKKSFHPDKAFIMPFSDTTNEDLQAFLFSVRGTEGVKGADLKMEKGKAVITVDTKTSMVTMWNHLEKEFKNRYTVTDRTPKGFILADSYQTNNQTSATNKEPTKDDQKQTTKDVQKQNTKSVYEQAEQDAAKDYQNPDTSKGNKSIWQQQKDYAEQMRQRDKDRANEIYGKNNNLYYKNPENYVTAAPKEKGEWYVEYTLNGKKVTMYLADEKLLNRSAGKVIGEITCHFLTPKPYKLFDLSITNPASYPDVKKFEFGKPAVYSKMFKAGVYDAPKAPVSEHALVEFHFGLKFSEGNPDDDVYHVYTFTGQEEKTEKKLSSNIQSGYFEILYFESRENGILEARFAFTAKNVPYGWGGKKKDFIVTDGKLRIRLDNRQK